MTRPIEVAVTLYGANRPPADDRPTVQVTAVTWPIEEPAPPAPVTPRPRRRVRLLVAVAGAAALLGAVAGVGAYAYAGDVPRGTTVLGTELGGRSRAEAVRELQAEVDRRSADLAKPLVVRVGERTVEIVPGEVGLAVDVPASVAAATGASAHLVNRLVGSRSVQPVVSVDVEIGRAHV